MRPWLPALLLLSGCVSAPKPAHWTDVPGWRTDHVQEAWHAFLDSCAHARPEWITPCEAARSMPGDSDEAVRRYFEAYFQPYRIPGSGLVTGYFEPQLHGSRTPSKQYVAPLYAPPPDLLTVDLASLYPELKGKRVRGRLEGKKVVPYYARGQVPSGSEIVWIDNAFEAMMLEVQGSGRVQLPDGTVIRLAYADQNGQPYHAVGRYLVNIGALTVAEANIPGIRAWLVAHPDRMQEVLDANPSVVFFSEAPLGDPNLGPKGSQGVPLTAGRSIAVDTKWVPLGTPVFLATALPDSGEALERLVIAQDTGGAIQG